MSALLRPTESAREHHPDASMTWPSSCVGQNSAQPGVGPARGAASSLDDELELHIEDCQWQYLTAYERFQLHGNPHDRDEALLHLHRMNEAIRARSPAVQALRHAEFERQLTEQVAYFTSESAMQLGKVA